MRATEKTRQSFGDAIHAVLTEDSERWPDRVIYAENCDGEMLFGACNAPAVDPEAIVWMHVDGDTFGVLSGNLRDDANGIEANCYQQAVNDTEDAIAAD